MNLLPIAVALGAWTPEYAPLWDAAIAKWKEERQVVGLCVHIEHTSSGRYRIFGIQRCLTTLSEVRCYLETGTSTWTRYAHTGKYPVSQRIKDEVIANLRSRHPIRFA